MQRIMESRGRYFYAKIHRAEEAALTKCIIGYIIKLNLGTIPRFSSELRRYALWHP